MNGTSAGNESPSSAWAPFGHLAFALLWTATVVSNVGTWMHDVASGWLMTSLSSSPSMVALVQAATTAPIFLFALGAGALADILDRRRLLVTVMAIQGISAAVLGVLVMTDGVNAWTLLAFTFLSGACAAFIAPAWQAIVPQLVPKAELQSAVVLNSVGINISRAIGPALAGVIIPVLGIAWPYLLNAVSFIVVIGVLLWWSPPAKPAQQLPLERFWSATRAGLRFARASGPLKNTLARAIAFFVFASAYWALLPLIVRQELQGGASLYGLMLGVIGLGAVTGALVLPRIRKKLRPDALVSLGTLGTALVLFVFAVSPWSQASIIASFLAGACWITVLSSLNVSAQIALPDWVRARGLSIFITVFFGSMTLGSLAWGQLAEAIGIPMTLLLAAAGSVIAALMARPFRLHQGAELDLSPSAHWPQPVVSSDVEYDRGPVMVTIEYRVASKDTEAFVAAMNDLRQVRQRNGAYAWGLFEDVAVPGHFTEYFLEESWVEHLRHHERVSESDRLVQERVRTFHIEPEPPQVRHHLAPERHQNSPESANPPSSAGELL